MLKKLCAFLLALLMTVSFVACGNNDTGATTETPDSANSQEASAKADSTNEAVSDYSEHYTVSTSGPGGTLGIAVSGYDPLISMFEEKFNITYEYNPVSWDSWNETFRIWINSGDMPDFITWNFNYTDYKNFVEQGLFKELPSDMSSWPNIDKMITKTGVGPEIKERFNNKIYMIPRIIYNKPPTDPLIGHTSLYFRKDWCEQVGFEVKDVYTINEILDMARAFNTKKAELGFQRAIDINRNDLLGIFMNSFNIKANAFKGFYKDESGVYKWWPADSSTLEGLKLYQQAYKEGLLDADFYSRTNFTENDDFAAGMSGMFYLCGTASCANGYYSKFAAANPDKDLQSTMGMAIVRGNDNVFYGTETINFWTAQVFNPSIEQGKFERILDMMDYITTEEGQLTVRLGLEGVDWKRSGDKLEITREKTADGRFVPLSDKYKGGSVLKDITVLSDGFALIDPTLPEWMRQQAINNFNNKGSSLNVLKTDWDLYFFSGPNYNKFAIEFGDEYAKIVVEPGDLEANWKKWVAEKKPMVDAVLEELNAK